MTLLRALSLLTLSPLLLAACGGSTTSGSGSNLDGGAGTGGSAAGGVSGSGGGGISGSGGAGNGDSGTGGNTVCCTVEVACEPGDEEISGPDQCPADAECYTNSVCAQCGSHPMCCSTVWCIRTCDVYPTCDPGDTDIDYPCPPPASCYARTVCNTTVRCLDVSSPVDAGPPVDAADAAACNPDAEYNRHYVSTDPLQCQVIDIECTGSTTYFANDCGCGCEQDASCPPSVDCMPGSGTSDPLCTQEGQLQCPYTIRAL